MQTFYLYVSPIIAAYFQYRTYVSTRILMLIRLISILSIVRTIGRVTNTFNWGKKKVCAPSGGGSWRVERYKRTLKLGHGMDTGRARLGCV